MEPAGGLLLCDDFMWVSRITGVAKDQGLKVRAAKTLEKLEELARVSPPECVILDLDALRIDAVQAVERLRALSPGCRLVAYGSHVDAAALRAAREAGCDPVLPRSRMAEELPALLPQWMH